MRWQVLSAILGHQDDKTSDEGSLNTTDQPTIVLDDGIDVQDQIPAHMPAMPPMPALPVSLKTKDLPKYHLTAHTADQSAKKRTFVPFDAETANRSQESKSRRRWLVVAVIVGVTVAALTIGLSVGLQPNRRHPRQLAESVDSTSASTKVGHASSIALPANETIEAVPADNSDGASNSTTESLAGSSAAPEASGADVPYQGSPATHFMPLLPVGTAYDPSSSFQDDSPFKTVDWYNVVYTSRTLNSTFVADVLAIIIRRLMTGGLLPDDPSSTTYFLDVNSISRPTLWMYLRESAGRFPNLMTLLRLLADDTPSTETITVECATEVRDWVHQAAIQQWLTDFWERLDQSTKMLEDMYWSDSDRLLQAALAARFAMSKSPTTAAYPLLQLQRFVASNPTFSRPGIPDPVTPHAAAAPSSMGQGGRRLRSGGSTHRPEAGRRSLRDTYGSVETYLQPFGAELQASRLPHVEIPIVFHVLCYMEGGYQQPAGAYWDEFAPYWRLVNLLNLRYAQSGTNISFHISEVHNDCGKDAYLRMDGYAEWQACAAEGKGCTSLLAKAHNQDTTTHINVWVGGTTVAAVAAGDCAGCNSAFTWTPPFSWSKHPETETESWASQHIFMSWDAVDPAIYNNADSWDYGAWLLTHEVGHYLGLRHPGSSSCSSPHGDMVGDTPRSVSPVLTPWYLQADLWCSEMRETGAIPSESPLQFNSCPYNNHQGSMDPIFSLMSEGPLPCSLFLTPGQSYMLHATMSRFRPTMYVQGQP